MRNVETKKLGQFLWDDLRSLLPEGLEKSFKVELKKIYPSILNEEEKVEVNFVLHQICPDESPIE